MWTPVAFGCGAACYFALLREPQTWVAIAGVAVAAGLLLVANRWNGPRAGAAALVLLACALGGFSMAKLRTGAPPPAERSAVTAAVAFGAMLFDRQAISLHALALAALVVLLLQPEAVTQPGFQMSFAATAVLVALAEVWPHPVKEINTPWPIRIVQGFWTWTLAGAAASFVAGTATAPFAMQHFNRISTWGLISNMVTEPISGFLMMPGLAIGAVLAPFGLGAWPLHVAGFAIDLMNQVAHVAASAPHALINVASGPAWTLPTAFLGLLWLCLWKGPLRWLGLPLALAVNLAPKPPAPDVWADSAGAAVAVRSGSDALLFRPDVKLFGAELWARRRGLVPLETAAARDADFDCDHWSCTPLATAPLKVAAAWNLKRPLKDGRLAQICGSSELVILRNDFPPESCPAPLVLTGVDFARGGSAELYRQPNGTWRVVWAQDLRGRRPWTWGPDAGVAP